MHPGGIISLMLIGFYLCIGCTLSTALSCDSCGQECAAACGSRHFRTCCFNYLRKRSFPPNQESQLIDPYLNLPGLRLELWLAKSRAARNLITDAPIELLSTPQQLQRHKNALIRTFVENSRIKPIENIPKIVYNMDKDKILKGETQESNDMDNSSKIDLNYDV